MLRLRPIAELSSGRPKEATTSRIPVSRDAVLLGFETKRSEQGADVDGVGLLGLLAERAGEPLRVPYGAPFYFKFVEMVDGIRHAPPGKGDYPSAG